MATELKIDVAHKQILEWLRQNNYTYNPSGRTGGDVANKVGLQILANHYNIEKIEVEAVEINIPKGYAVMRCTASGPRGTFTDYGSASPANLKKQMRDYFVEMASTRAQNRALTRYVGLGLVTEDEMPDSDEDYIDSMAMELYDDATGEGVTRTQGLANPADAREDLRKACIDEGISLVLVEDFAQAELGMSVKELDSDKIASLKVEIMNRKDNFRKDK
tara:strand:- start:1104 stop:1760 length:657 start_codon:yes stop_codon:yes gene_type:complete